MPCRWQSETFRPSNSYDNESKCEGSVLKMERFSQMNCGKMEKFIQMKSDQNREIQSNEYPILRFSQTKSGQNGEVQTN